MAAMTPQHARNIGPSQRKTEFVPTVLSLPAASLPPAKPQPEASARERIPDESASRIISFYSQILDPCSLIYPCLDAQHSLRSPHHA